MGEGVDDGRRLERQDLLVRQVHRRDRGLDHDGVGGRAGLSLRHFTSLLLRWTVPPPDEGEGWGGGLAPRRGSSKTLTRATLPMKGEESDPDRARSAAALSRVPCHNRRRWTAASCAPDRYL